MNIRNNHIHQATARLVKTKPMRIVVEDLSISNLLKTKTIESIFISKIKLLLSMFVIQVREVRIAYVKADKWFASSKICSCCGVKYDHSVQPEGQWSLKYVSGVVFHVIAITIGM